MKIDYITAHDPHDIRSWSGLNYFIMQALKDAGAEFNIITSLHAKPDFGLKWRYHFYLRQGKNYQYERTHCYARQFGEQVNAQLSEDADIILATTSAALAYIQTDKPVFLYTDATFDNLAEYYDHFSNLPASSKKMGDEVERMAYKNCAAIFFSSDWAASSAIQFYKTDPSKVHVVPFGANLSQVPATDVIEKAIRQRSKDHIKLLWAGVEYKRKGGPFALSVTEQLRKQGMNASITFIGIKAGDIETPLPSYATATGFLNKADPEQMHTISNYFSEAHFFLFPTRMDCSPIVLSEANAFGLPCLTSDVSGIPTIIDNGINGFTFSPSANVDDYAAKLACVLEESGQYEAMATKSRSEYDRRLNWDAAINKLLDIAHRYFPVEI